MEPQLSSERARRGDSALLFAKRGCRSIVLALTLMGCVGAFSLPVALAETAPAESAPTADSPAPANAEASSDSAAASTASEAGPKEGEVHLDRPVAPAEVRKRRGKHVRARKQRDKWWQMARTTLFTGIELTPDQDKEVTAIIQAQKQSRTEYSKYDIQLAAARAANDLIRARELRQKVKDSRKQVQSLHEVLDSIRQVLTEKQQVTFDVNRAKLIAEGQAVRKNRIEKREKKANSADAAAAESDS